MFYITISLATLLLFLDTKWVYIRRQEIKELIKKLWIKIKPFMTWRILVCYLPWWGLASGWAYFCAAFCHGWLRAVSITWLAILYMPWCPEKVVTIPLTIWLHKKLFPKHSVAQLNEVLEKEKSKK